MQVTDLWENEWISCTTEEECNKILDLMHDAWLKWSSWKSYKEERIMEFLNEWQVYFPYIWKYDRKEYCIAQWYKLYPASDFIWEESKKVFEKLYIKFEEGNQESLDNACKEAERLWYSKLDSIYALRFEWTWLLLLKDTWTYTTSTVWEEQLIEYWYKEHKKIEENIVYDTSPKLTETNDGVANCKLYIWDTLIRQESEPTKWLIELIPKEHTYNLIQITKKIKRFRL